MIIRKLRTNHIENPVGFAMDQITLSYIAESDFGVCQKAARIRVATDVGMKHVVYDSGMSTEIDSIAFSLPFKPEPATRYYWDVTIEIEAGCETAAGGTCKEADGSGICGTTEEGVIRSEPAYFETAIDMTAIRADFIEAQEEMDVAEFFAQATLPEEPVAVRAYASALGVYELRVDGEKVGDEYLAPASNDYDSWLQVQTYDLDGILTAGTHEVSMAVAPGWYSGYFGFDGKKEIYGKEKAALLQIEILYADGSRQQIATDERWLARQCAVRYAEIYHGEVFEPGFVSDADCAVRKVEVEKKKLSPRRSLPIRVMETVPVKEIITTPVGETVIDLGQNMVGWLAFRCHAPEGSRIYLQYGEILQNGNFYRENLRTAKAEYTYISDGQERLVRPHFTYYGFRYVKVEGFKGDLNPGDFVGEVVYSEMDVIGSIETDNPEINRLALNALWGQKGNFVDVPSDCPQRDERMGWTGDAQVFSGTALYNMDAYAFYSKYGYDMMLEQEKYDGCVPMVIPSFHMGPGGSCAWADASTVIPWNVYLYSGDAAILRQQYPSMKMWADYIYRQDEANGGRGLWQTGFHFGDWLALDGTDPNFPTGATDPFYVASAYYYLSTRLTGQAAGVIGYKEEENEYLARADKIRAALQKEYFTEDGDLKLTTQTGYILALAFEFCPEESRERMAGKLSEKIMADGGHLMTGFVGTPYICRVLSEYGFNETAYQVLFYEDCPGWLYPVRLGATTIWERWNSVLPDGSMNPEGMNSLNHYAYGSIAEWMYRYMGGIQPMEEKPGFREIRLTPMPNRRLGKANVCYDSPVGRYVSRWDYTDEGVKYYFEIPFGAKAHAKLQCGEDECVKCNGRPLESARRENGKVLFMLEAGKYEVCV